MKSLNSLLAAVGVGSDLGQFAQFVSSQAGRALSIARNLTADFGTPIANAPTQSIVVANGTRRQATTLSQDSVVTLLATGAKKGQQLTILRTSLDAFTLTIEDNGAPAADEVVILPVSMKGFATFQFDGTHWRLFAMGSGVT